MMQVTQKTITTSEALASELAAIKNRGYAIDDEEHAIGLRCIAAPVFNEFDEVVAAISVSGPTARIPDNRLEPLGEMVLQAAFEATRDFGGSARKKRA